MDEHKDWTGWIITTLFTALTAVVGTVVALTRFIGNRYTLEIAEQKKAFLDHKAEMKIEIDVLKASVIDCQEDRFKLTMQLHELRTERIAKKESDDHRD